MLVDGSPQAPVTRIELAQSFTEQVTPDSHQATTGDSGNIHPVPIFVEVTFSHHQIGDGLQGENRPTRPG
jgi:hypothetical protein